MPWTPDEPDFREPHGGEFGFVSPWDHAEHLAEQALNEDMLLPGIDLLERALELVPHRRDWRSELARRYELADNFTRAEQLWSELWAEDTDNPDIAAGWARTLQAQARHRECLRVLEHALSLYPHHEPLLCLKLAGLVATGRLAEVDPIYSQARQLRADCPVCDLHLGEARLATGNVGDAAEIAERLVRTPFNPQLPVDWDRSRLWFVGRVAMAFQRYDDAAAAFRELLNEHPPHPEARRRAAEALLLAGKPDAAIALAGEPCTLGTPPRPELAPSFADFAQILIQARRHPEKALHAAQTALDIDPTLPHVHLLIAKASIQSGRLNLARDHLRREMRVADPGDPSAAFALALAWLHARRPRHALAVLDRFDRLGGMPTAPLAALRAAIQLQRRRYTDGLAAAYTALRLEPHRPDVLHNLAVAEARRGDFTAAQSWARLLESVTSDITPLRHQITAMQLRQWVRRLIRRWRA